MPELPGALSDARVPPHGSPPDDRISMDDPPISSIERAEIENLRHAPMQSRDGRREVGDKRRERLRRLAPAWDGVECRVSFARPEPAR